MRSLRIFGALVAVAALGQQPPARPPAQPASPSGPAVKFSANSNLVIVDVTVKDKAGQAIENLKFSAAVPLKLARETVSERLADADGVLQTVDAPITAAHGPASASAAAN